MPPQHEVDESQLQAFIALGSRSKIKPAYYERRLSATDSTPENSPPIGSNSATDMRRLRDVVDSLANICVGKAQSEVVAVALKWSSTRNGNTVNLLISTNSEVPSTMQDHLYQIWHMMRGLASNYEQVGPPDNVESPPRSQPELDSVGQQLQAMFRNKILNYSWAKFCRRVNTRFAKFRIIDKRLDCPKTFMDINRLVERIEEKHTRYQHPIEGKPRTPEEWEDFWVAIRGLRSHVDQFKFPELWLRRVSGEFDVRRWLLKLTSITKDIGVLLSVTRSPRCRLLFRSASFQVTPLLEKGPSLRVIPLPRSQADWCKVVETTLQRRNSYLEYINELEIVPDTVNCNVNNLLALVQAGKLCSATTVHCECRIMSRLVEELKLQLPRAYSPIGVSKLSCSACWEFMQAVNEIYGTRFETKGCHHKWYYPWRCPRMKKEAEIRTLMHDQAAVKFSNTYDGFRLKQSSLLSDSEGQTMSEDEDAEERQYGYDAPRGY